MYQVNFKSGKSLEVTDEVAGILKTALKEAPDSFMNFLTEDEKLMFIINAEEIESV